MVNDWSLRKEFLTGAQRWPVIVLFVTAGALLGWLAALVWPSPSRASAGLYVGLDTYRALEDRNAETQAHLAFNYPDDYKNWQMGNLNAFVFSQPVLEVSLNTLREQDSYWQDLSFEEFSGMVDAYWRNPGKWRLTVDHADPQRAAQAAIVWRDVVLKAVNDAVANARATLMTDIELQGLASREAELLANQAALSEIEKNLQALQSRLAAGPDSALGGTERMQVLAWAGQAAALNPAWQPLLDGFPAEDASAGDYLPWIEQALVLAGEDLSRQGTELAALAETRSALEQAYNESARGSGGFSSTLIVEKLSEGTEEIETLRPTGLLILVGGVLGLLAWTLVWLGRIALRGEA